MTQGKLVKFIPVPSADVSLAAGSKKLFIGLKDLGQVQKWDLAKLAHESNVNIPEGLASMAMGPDADGPLVVLAPQHVKRSWLVDARQMRVAPFPWKNWDPGGAWGPVHAHVSFDGTTAVGCGGGWAGIDMAVLAPDHVVALEGGGYVNGDTLVSGDGSLVFPDGGGILRADLASKVEGPPGTAFPADDPAVCLSFEEHESKPRLHVFFTADVRTVITLTDLPELAGKSPIRPEQRIHLIPRYSALVTLGEGGSKLFVRHFDLAESLQAAGIDYLFVDSAPVHWVLRGGAYKYPIHVKSKAGGVKYSLESGPKGMRITPQGILQWNAGDSLPDAEATVIVQISDLSGRQIFHTFKIEILDRAHVRIMTNAEPPEQHRVIPLRKPG